MPTTGLVLLQNLDSAKVINRESNRMDRWIREAIHIRKKTRQVDEPRRWVLPTSTHLWLLTVRQNDTWWTFVPTKAAAVAEMSTMYIKIVIWWIYQRI